MAKKQEGAKAPFGVTSVTVMQLSGTDQVRVKTTLPSAVYPYEGNQMLSFEVTKGMGVEYVRTHFNIEPEVLRV